MKSAALFIDNTGAWPAVYRMLAAADYFVDVTADLATGLARLAARDYDIIVSIDGPRAESWRACEKLRRVTTAPIIVIAPRASAETCVRTINAGADFFLRKPFGPLEFLARVRSLRRPHLTSPVSLS
jgi:DNA-binding response OmpR family regulator